MYFPVIIGIHVNDHASNKAKQECSSGPQH